MYVRGEHVSHRLDTYIGRTRWRREEHIEEHIHILYEYACGLIAECKVVWAKVDAKTLYNPNKSQSNSDIICIALVRTLNQIVESES